MTRIFLAFLLLFTLSPLSTSSTFAQDSEIPTTDQYMQGQVTSIIDEGENEIEGQKYPFQVVKVKILDGPEKDSELTIDHGQQLSIKEDQKVNSGDKVVILKSETEGVVSYNIVDQYRLDNIIWLVGIFFLVVLVINRLKGLGSLVGLVISLGVITFWIVPQILAGQDPLVTSIIGSLVILISTLYLAHGFTANTNISIVATFITLVVTAILAISSVTLAQLTGLGSEEAYTLTFGPTADINFQGFLLGGIIIGALGVLDDVTTTQVAAVGELWSTDPKQTLWGLFARGFNIGKEHISSLVNTLVLAYAGASLPVFIILAVNANNYPLWVTLNSEFLSEEVIRAIVGSLGLIFSVPIATLLSAWYYSRKKKSI
jgi:uncharacterized membrane protein